MSHTPGPWSIKTGQVYANEITALSPRGKTWVIARTSAAKVGRDADDRNARLIAAAPDLLEALSALVSAYEREETSPFIQKYWADCHAAIAKAQGA